MDGYDFSARKDQLLRTQGGRIPESRRDVGQEGQNIHNLSWFLINSTLTYTLLTIIKWILITTRTPITKPTIIWMEIVSIMKNKLIRLSNRTGIKDKLKLHLPITQKIWSYPLTRFLAPNNSLNIISLSGKEKGRNFRRHSKLIKIFWIF